MPLGEKMGIFWVFGIKPIVHSEGVGRWRVCGCDCDMLSLLSLTRPGQSRSPFVCCMLNVEIQLEIQLEC